MTEQWLPVVGFENSYEVSDHGVVRSVDRTTVGPRGTVRRHQGRVLAPTTWSKRRLRVALWSEGRCIMRQVHHLVLEAFVGPRPTGTEACHENDISDDNRLENLRWDTPSENVHDAVRNGRHHLANKTECPQGHQYDSFNTRTHNGKRYCRACQRIRARERYWRRK